jgi:hypothetical protein
MMCQTFAHYGHAPRYRYGFGVALRWAPIA